MSNIKKRRLEIGATLEEIASVVGVSKTTVQRWESGNIENMKRDKIALLAKALHTTPLFVLGLTDCNLDREMSECTLVPVIGSIAAGVPLEESQSIEGYVEVAGDTSDTYALRVHGDSMDPEIHDGDSVIIEKKNSYKNGDIVVARVNGYEYTVKKYHRDKSNIMLIPINRDFVPMVYDENTIAIEGKVIEVRRKYA